MTAPQFRGDYEMLAQIAQAFGQHASLTKTSLQRIQREVNTLQSGDWIGTGANAFYRGRRPADRPEPQPLHQELIRPRP